jgi:imidazolonepropionase-like amidohydrolase
MLKTLRLTALLAGLATAGLLSACATASTTPPTNGLPQGSDATTEPAPFASTYKPLPSQRTAIVGAHILTATGDEIETGTLVMDEGKIVALGKDVPVPMGAKIINAKGLWLTPGIIDSHSHLGVYASPGVQAHSDGNEATDPNTANVWAEHSVWPQDPGFNRARAGGVTTMQILPGSANLFGGRSVTLKNVPSITTQGMKFPDAPYGLKMACGENPKRVYGHKGRAPSTRMGNVAGYRNAWIAAASYKRKWEDYRAKIAKGEEADPPERDLTNDTLSGVLAGEILVQNHCYRADEMATMIDISKEFGFKISMFHHSSEAYKIADLLARQGICYATWADWAGFKLESYDGIAENAAIGQRKGACVVIHSDDPIMAQHLNQEAAIAMAAGNRLGLAITRAEAISWITANPAKAMGIGDKTGSLVVGKNADLVLWSGDPFSVYSTANQVFIDGA